MAAPSYRSVKSSNRRRRYSDLPPSYDVAAAEPHGFIDSKIPRVNRFRDPPEPSVSNGPLSPNRLIMPQNDASRDTETAPLSLDPTCGELRVEYTVPDDLLAQCAQYGHVEKMEFGTLSIIAAAVFFPWGLLCMAGSRVVYCERCSLVLRAPGGRKDIRRGQSRGRRPSKFHHHGRHRVHC